MKAHKCLAYIWPAEDYTDKEFAMANVNFINGPFAKKSMQCRLTTSIYKYYFWGVTFEVVSVTDQGYISTVADVRKEDLAEFGMGIAHALTFNSVTHEVLASNGFVYKLDQSLFYRNCRFACERIYQEMETADNFVMQMYTLNGGIVAVLFDKNLDPKRPGYQYAVHRGFVTGDNKVLRTLVPRTAAHNDDNVVLKQPEIDVLVREMLRE